MFRMQWFALLALWPAAAPAQQHHQGNVAIPAITASVEIPAGAVALPQSRSFVAARVDTRTLAAMTPSDVFTLEAAPGRTLALVVRRIERRNENSYSLFGSIEGLDNSTFIIVVQDEVAAADILAPSHGLHYRFKYAGDGVHLICDVVDQDFAPCGVSARTPAVDLVPDAGEVDPEAGGPESPPADPNSSGSCLPVLSVFDAMIVYSSVARAAAGGTAAIQAEIQLAIERTNEAYFANSAIFAKYRLVWQEEVSYDEIGTYQDHLDRLRSSGAAPWAGVRARRDNINADFCTLWVDDSEFCGLAGCTVSSNNAFSVVTWHCAAGNLSHAHELGHNQGCAHDPDNDDGGCAAFAHSFGHRFFGNDSLEYRTIMAVAPGSRIPHFSNPNRIFMGTPQGTALRDNARTINERRQICEAFRQTRYDIWVDFSWDGSESGTFFNPYNTVPEGVANIAFPGLGASEIPHLHIKEGTTSFTGAISKVMRVSSCGGAVRIGG